MARGPRQVETLPDRSAADLTARAARHALLTCALAFGQSGGGEREVLFAVARSYTAARARYWDERLASGIVEVDDGQIGRSLLRRAEGSLCAAAKALPHFSRHTVRRLVRAARAYTDAWELDRAWALRLPRFRATFRSTRVEGAQRPSNALEMQHSRRHP